MPKKPQIHGIDSEPVRTYRLTMKQEMQFVAAGLGRELRAPDATLVVKIDAGHTGNEYELFEVDAPRGPATPLHRTGWGKAYYLLAGRMLVQVGDSSTEMGPGDSISIPPAARHTFTVMSSSARFLVISTGTGMGRFHLDLDQTVTAGLSEPETFELLATVLGRHDVTVEGMEARP